MTSTSVPGTTTDRTSEASPLPNVSGCDGASQGTVSSWSTHRATATNVRYRGFYALAPLGEQVQPFGHSDEIAAGLFAKVAQLGGPSHVTVAALRSSLGGFVPRVDERPHLSFVSRGERLGGRTVV